MAYEKERPKGGMEGRTSRTERWGKRADVKLSTKKRRRREDETSVREQREDD